MSVHRDLMLPCSTMHQAREAAGMEAAPEAAAQQDQQQGGPADVSAPVAPSTADQQDNPAPGGHGVQEDAAGVAGQHQADPPDPPGESCQVERQPSLGHQPDVPVPGEHALQEDAAGAAGQQQEREPPAPPSQDKQRQASVAPVPDANHAGAAAARSVPKGKGSKRNAAPSIAWEPQFTFATPANRARAEEWHAVWMRQDVFLAHEGQRLAHAFGEQDVCFTTVKGMADLAPLHELAFPAGMPATWGKTKALDRVFADIKAGEKKLQRLKPTCYAPCPVIKYMSLQPCTAACS